MTKFCVAFLCSLLLGCEYEEPPEPPPSPQELLGMAKDDYRQAFDFWLQGKKSAGNFAFASAHAHLRQLRVEADLSYTEMQQFYLDTLRHLSKYYSPSQITLLNQAIAEYDDDWWDDL